MALLGLLAIRAQGLISCSSPWPYPGRFGAMRSDGHPRLAFPNSSYGISEKEVDEDGESNEEDKGNDDHKIVRSLRC